MAQEEDGLNSSIKSRKALQNAISDKTAPKTIKHLKLTMAFVILSLMSISITAFIMDNDMFDQINLNFNLLKSSFGRIQEFQRVVYDIRNIIFVNEDIITDTKLYSPSEDFV